MLTAVTRPRQSPSYFPPLASTRLTLRSFLMSSFTATPIPISHLLPIFTTYLSTLCPCSFDTLTFSRHLKRSHCSVCNTLLGAAPVLKRKPGRRRKDKSSLPHSSSSNAAARNDGYDLNEDDHDDRPQTETARTLQPKQSCYLPISRFPLVPKMDLTLPAVPPREGNASSHPFLSPARCSYSSAHDPSLSRRRPLFSLRFTAL